MDLLITGGTGFLGRHLAAALQRRGHRVRLLGRNFAGVGGLLANGAVPLAVDLRDRGALVAACAGADAVYHVGALSAPWGKRADFHAINVGGTEAVIEGCRRHAVGRLIYVSSPSVVFDGRDHCDLTEDAPYPRRFASVYSLTKKLAEDRVNAATDLQSVILRPKAIFGPGDQALLPRMVRRPARAACPRSATGATWSTSPTLRMLSTRCCWRSTSGDRQDLYNHQWRAHPVVGYDSNRAATARAAGSPAPGAAAGRVGRRRADGTTCAVTGQEPLLTRYSVRSWGGHRPTISAPRAAILATRRRSLWPKGLNAPWPN